MGMGPSAGKNPIQIIRLAGVVTGIFVLIWLPREDTNLAWVLGLAALMVSLLTAGLITRQLQKTHSPDWTLALLGAISGGLVGVIGILLMAIKTGLHGHGVADFTPAQMRTVLAITPLGCLLGALAGGSVAWLRRKG